MDVKSPGEAGKVTSGKFVTLTKAVISGSFVVAYLLFAASLVLTVLGQLWISQLGGLSSVGLASVCALYVLSEHRFNTSGVAPMKSVVLALLFANAFLQSYEIVYGFSFLPSINGAELRTILLWFLMLSPLVLMYDHLRFKRTSGLVLVLFVAVWIVWFLFGFPQYYIEGYPFPQILRTNDPFHLSLWLNFGSKAILATFYASLLEPVSTLRDLFGARKSGNNIREP